MVPFFGLEGATEFPYVVPQGPFGEAESSLNHSRKFLFKVC